MKKINTHMTLSDRIVIEQGLRDGKSFKDIAAIIQKDATAVSKEIRRAVNSDDWKTDPVDCFYVDTCRETHLCISDCTSFCKYCSAVDCTQFCSRWKPKHCKQYLIDEQLNMLKDAIERLIDFIIYIVNLLKSFIIKF